MPAVLNTNAASLYASKNLQSAQAKMADSVERLSSGLRINRARDDAAGLGISNALTTQINAANQGVRNLNDGISLVQTAEGALGAAQEMAQRVLTLAVQGANGTMSDDQRVSLRQEMRQLMSAIDSIATRTKFGNSSTSMLNYTAITIQASNQTTDTISITVEALGKIGVGTTSDGAGGATILANTNGTWANASAGATATAGAALMQKIAVGAAGTNLTSTTMTNIATAAETYIKELSTQRGLLGAIQNQIEFAASNVTELSANLTAARSNIQDTDYASETANLTKGQILQQAATAMLAQANQMPNVILSLLK
jgi:flagellin